ncbi:MAG: hypothetical protein WDN30_14120 [Pararobbsia sp.]
MGSIIGAVGSVVGAGVSASSQPDTSGLNNAAENADNVQAQIAQQQWQDYQTNFQPLEAKFVNQANNWTTPQNYDKAAGDAAATVNSQFASAKQSLERTPGADPSSGAYQAGITIWDWHRRRRVQLHKTRPGPMYKNQGIAMQENALSLGKGLPTTAADSAKNAATACPTSQNLLTARMLRQRPGSVVPQTRSLTGSQNSFTNNSGQSDSQGDSQLGDSPIYDF